MAELRRAEGEADVEYAERMTRARLGRLRGSGIPARWHDATFDDLDTEETLVRRRAVQAAGRWASGELWGLVIAGSVGIGKSRIVATAAVERLAVGWCRWLSVSDLLLKLRLPFDALAYREAIAALDVPHRGVALVLDDFDKLRPGEREIQPLYVAVNNWVDADQPIAVTMNRPLAQLADEFGARFGDPIASRLAETCEVYELSGRDRRLDP